MARPVSVMRSQNLRCARCPRPVTSGCPTGWSAAGMWFSSVVRMWSRLTTISPDRWREIITQRRPVSGSNDEGAFEERTDTHLPRLPLSLGDAEPGDVDVDGDLDPVPADWGPGHNMTNAGGRTRIALPPR